MAAVAIVRGLNLKHHVGRAIRLLAVTGLSQGVLFMMGEAPAFADNTATFTSPALFDYSLGGGVDVQLAFSGSFDVNSAGVPVTPPNSFNVSATLHLPPPLTSLPPLSTSLTVVTICSPADSCVTGTTS